MLTQPEWLQIQKACDSLRALGCAVTVMTPDDVKGYVEDVTDGQITDTRVEEFMADNYKRIEEAMATAGNEAVAGLLDYDGLLPA